MDISYLHSPKKRPEHFYHQRVNISTAFSKIGFKKAITFGNIGQCYKKDKNRPPVAIFTYPEKKRKEEKSQRDGHISIFGQNQGCEYKYEIKKQNGKR